MGPACFGDFCGFLIASSHWRRDNGPGAGVNSMGLQPPETAAYAEFYGTQEQARSSTLFRELAPEASASTNSATWATRGGSSGPPEQPDSQAGLTSNADPR